MKLETGDGVFQTESYLTKKTDSIVLRNLFITDNF